MSKKLLLADDSITIQKVIGITFANEEYALSVVDNGDAALDKARAQRPDLILADVFMPGKNGYELCAAVKSDPALGQIPVLLLAGTFEPFDEGKARQAGADGWIAKPFESQALIDRVEDLLARPLPPVETIPAPVAPVVAEPPVAVPVAEQEAEDAEPDLWAELGPLAAPTFEEAEAEGPLPAAETAGMVEGLPEGSEGGAIDDLWGEVSLGEEDLAPAGEPSAEDIWSDLETAAPTPASTAAPADIWEDLAPAAEPTPQAEPSAPAAETEEEEVFLVLDDEEDVTELLEPAEDKGEGEEAFLFVEDEALAEDLSEAAALPVEEAVSFAAAEPGEEDLLELGEADIMSLDDADILELEDLEPLEEASTEEEILPITLQEDSTPAQEELADLMLGELATAGEEPEEELLEIELEPEAEEPAPAATEASFADLVFEEEAPSSGVAAEPAPEVEPESLLVDSQLEEEPVWEVVEPEPAGGKEQSVEEFQDIASAAVVVAPASAAAVSAAAVAEQVGGLSEEELSRIVERVAGEVIERLAGTILERLAWEVVPDLAETLIREEIRKIRDSVA